MRAAEEVMRMGKMALRRWFMLPLVLAAVFAVLQVGIVSHATEPGDCTDSCGEACELICSGRGSQCTVVSCVDFGTYCRCTLGCADKSYWNCYGAD